jgi:GTP-binding protein EngB required for normal cell division
MKKKNHEAIMAAGRQESILFVGRAGAGKSILLNSIARKALFDGSTSSRSLQCKRSGDVTYMETSGLGDYETQKRAARAIDKALQKSGNYRVCFVVVLDQGRIRVDDATTIKAVLETVPAEGIIINKASSRLETALRKSDSMKSVLSLLLANGSLRPRIQLLLHLQAKWIRAELER